MMTSEVDTAATSSISPTCRGSPRPCSRSTSARILDPAPRRVTTFAQANRCSARTTAPSTSCTRSTEGTRNTVTRRRTITTGAQQVAKSKRRKSNSSRTGFVCDVVYRPVVYTADLQHQVGQRRCHCQFVGVDAQHQITVFLFQSQSSRLHGCGELLHVFLQAFCLARQLVLQAVVRNVLACRFCCADAYDVSNPGRS